jgi:tRNA 2-thiocytidine biosynthesis protein TtcA
MNAPTQNAWLEAVENLTEEASDEASQKAKALKIERETHKLEKRLCRQVGQAISEFNMIEEGDRIMVCMSGGKDSYGMLDILLKMKARAPVDFELIAVNLDQKQPGFPAEILPAYLKNMGIPFHIETQDTYSIVKDKIPEGKTMCSLCSRLRRGILYKVAGQLKCNKLALGHVAEADLSRWAEHRQFPIIPCTLCGSQQNLQRVQIGNMIREWQKKFPGRIENMFSALQNVVPSHLMDANLHDFKNLKITGLANEDGDKAFDDESFEAPNVMASLQGVQVVQL